MVSEVVIPVLDQTTTEVVLVHWLKNEGDPVEKGETICEIETEKATVEIEANSGGVLRRILIETGTTIPPMTVVALIADANEAIPEVDPYYRVESTAPQIKVVRHTKVEPTRTAKTAESPRPTERIMASPRAKRIASELGVDLLTVTGTGPRGRILEDDVRKVSEQVSEVDLDRIALATAQRVSQSWSTIPHFYTTMTMDLSRVVAQKAQMEEIVTYTDFFAQAIAMALKQHPRLNSHWKGGRLEVIPEVHLGLLVQTERGLMLPVLRDLHRFTLEEIAGVRKHLVHQTHAGKISAAAMTDATFTLSNLGPGHIDHFTAIISPPQVAILSVGSIQRHPLVVDEELVIRPTAMFTLGVDHRAIDGRTSAAFLEQVKIILER